MRPRRTLRRSNKSSSLVFLPCLSVPFSFLKFCPAPLRFFYSVLFLQGTLYKELNSNIQIVFLSFCPIEDGYGESIPQS